MEPRSLAPNARAAVSTAVCTLLAVAAHRSMSAAGIPVAAVAAGAAMVFCFTRIAAALGERGLGSIVLLVGGSQVGLHLLFQAVQAAAAQNGTVPAPGMPNMSGMPGVPDVRAMTTLPSGGVSLFGISGMTIAHAVAALLTAWWLRRGEAALFKAADRAGAVLGASWRILTWWIAGERPLRPTGPAVTAAGIGVRPAAARVLLFTMIRRGPPAAACHW